MTSSKFPEAHIPVTPVLSLAAFGPGTSSVRSILDAGEVRLVTSGRIAIALALQQMQIQAGDAVLMPSYHCASMIEPVTWLGARPVFYRINPDTSVDLDDVAAKIDGTCKVLLAANYFGFPQDLSALRAFCDARGIMLLEDCAHCFLGEHKGRPIGSWGDYAIASSMKFFPIYDGGVLVSARHSLANVKLESAGNAFEVKATLNALEDGFSYGRLWGVRVLLALPLRLKDVLWGQVKKRQSLPLPTLAPGSSDGGFGFDPTWLNKRASLGSRILLRLVSRSRMGQLRRQHYLALQEALRPFLGCRPLFQTLPDNVYPWVFPLLVDNAQQVFRHLKLQGVPIIRFGEFLWPGVDTSVCPVSVDLSKRVLAFSCHQELRPKELSWMIEEIKKALSMYSEPVQ